ncbi:glycine betaine ABC transporter substrate-binding protein [Tomitella gaofuii]|uniref:glycine betaine ABC transporter substrate-binding protein n=1 Tax=Tomitella gaofuii TaxID=2760083 RepID=UPI0015F81612|nr:glycine betaine ABC transporter substrate-binding protein [Tomitella gaofuii]
MRYRRSAAAAAAVVTAAVALTGCRSTTALEQEYSSTQVVVGSGVSAESRIVATIYAEALRGTGIGVSTDLGVGDRFDYVRALESGRISVVPDDTASLLAFFQRSNMQDTPGTAPDAQKAGGDTAATSDEPGAVSAVEEALSRALPQYLRVSDAALAERGQTLIVDDGTARKWDLHNVSDLAAHCADANASLAAGLVSDAQVRAALAESYGCTFAAVDVVGTPADAADAVTQGLSEVGGVTTLSPAASMDGFTALEDDRDSLPAGNIIPMYRTASLGDRQVEALNNVAGELTTDDLAAMVRRVEVDGLSVADVVGEWRAQHGV